MEHLRLKKADLILLGALFAAGAAAAGFFYAFNETGSYVCVSVSGQERARYSLDDEGNYRISTDEGYNVLVISESKAYIGDADCPDLLCVKSAGIYKKGQTIVCLPHRLVVEVEVEGEAEFDGVSN